MNKNEYFFKEGCFIEEWHNSPNDESMSVARVRVEFGKTTKLHSLKGTYERNVILEGVANVTVANKTRQVQASDVVVICPDEPQKITNTGSNDLIFLAICTPRFEEKNYIELGDI